VRASRASPLIGDLDGDGDLDVVSCGAGGGLFANDAVSGEALDGWPLSADPALASAWVGDAEGDRETDVLIAGAAGRVLFYAMPAAAPSGDMIWQTEAFDPSGTGALPDSLLGAPTAETPNLIAAGRTYCYPNPARESDLTIRVYLEEPAEIEVEVLDVAGERVANFVRDGHPTANEIVWDTEGVPSGLYFIHVEAGVGGPVATGPPGIERGRTESWTMKVAVIR
jgi:hypothetical protein